MNSSIVDTKEDNNTMSTRQFLDDNKIPYVLGLVNPAEKAAGLPPKKLPPTGWAKWSYERCMKYNEKCDKKFVTLMIDLKSSDYMVVDIDEKDDALHVKYSPDKAWWTPSLSKKCPHIWLKKQSDDPSSAIRNLNGDKVDLIYDVLFETLDSVMHNPIGTPAEFIWRDHVPVPTPKKKKPKKSTTATLKCPSPGATHGVSPKLEKLLNIINVKYWTNYHDWMRLVWAIKYEFGKEARDIAIKYSKLSPGKFCVDSVDDMLEKCDTQGRCTGGTIHHYAKLSDKSAYADIVCDKFTGDDSSIATLFLNAFGKHIVKDANDNIFIFYKQVWIRRKNAGLINYLIEHITAPIIELKKSQLLIDHEECQSIPDRADVEQKLKIVSAAIAKLRNGAHAGVYNKVKHALAELEQSTIEFDIGSDQYYNIQFKNGVYDLKTKTFRARNETDYITQTLDWNYSAERNPANIKIVEEFFKKIQPIKEDRDFSIGWMAHCLDGDVSIEKFKINIGSASNGKTMEFAIHAAVFPLYSQKLASKVFNVNYDKFHKDFYPLTYLPKRFVYIEELERKSKLNIDLIKDVVSGLNIPVAVMYGNTINIKLQATLAFCSNSDPNAESDGGITRRGLLQHYLSHFDNYEVDDYVNHKYIKQEGFNKQFNCEQMKLAYFHVLLDYYDYNKKLTIPQKIVNNFKDTLQEYDEFSHIFDNNFTKCEGSQVSRTEFISKIKEVYKKPWGAILSESKRIGIKYASQKYGGQFKKSKGCFINIKMNDDEIEEESDED